jgi:hypothetical protein
MTRFAICDFRFANGRARSPSAPIIFFHPAPPIRFSSAINQISFSAAVPFSEALQALEVQSLLPTSLSSREMEQISTEILERALFSARTTSAEYLQEIDDVLGKYVDGKIDLATARLQLKNKLQQLRYAPAPGEEGTITDLSSDERLNLVLNMNSAMATGYGNWLQGQAPPILDMWPAQELYRAFGRVHPREWETRWTDAAASTGSKYVVTKFDEHNFQAVALKNDPIWEAISRFGTPYPPFDFNSGMEVRDVTRAKAMELGLIDRDTKIVPQDRNFNQDLKATAQIRAGWIRAALEELGYAFDDEGSLHLE